MIFALLTLLAALALAAVAGWFSIIGIMSIYAGAAIHALIMGVVLEGGKLVTTSWLYRNWSYASWKLRAPLIVFTLTLMLATSIGVFGFLSKAHLEQGASTVDNGAKIERLNQQIAREKSVIADDEKVIGQLDATINSYIGKDRTDRSLSVRRSQAPQRKQLRDDIDASQKRVDGFSDEKLKLESEVRKLQLDVGPIRYIAELIYGVDNNTDKNIESAVRIFTLIIVSTLDPLAVILLIAANHTLLRYQNEKKEKAESDIKRGEEDRETTSGPTEASGPVRSQASLPPSTTAPAFSESIACNTDTPKDEALFFPVLSESMEVVNETSEEHSKENASGAEQGDGLSTDLGVAASKTDNTIQMGNLYPETNAASTEHSNTQEIHTSPAENMAELEINEEDTILERFQLSDLPVSLPIIRQPGPSRVSTIAIPKRDNTEPIIAKVEEPILPVEPKINWAEQNPVFREIIGSGPHFIPRKVHEEEKPKKAEADSDSISEALQEISEYFFPKNATETLHSITQGKNIQKVETEADDRIAIAPTTISKSNKYPKALSWLNEFKRS